MPTTEFCCYAGNEEIICEETYCDECEYCPDRWGADEEDDD